MSSRRPMTPRPGEGGAAGGGGAEPGRGHPKRVPPKTRRRFTAQQRVEFVKRWRRSDLSRRDFCAKHDLVLTTFHGWVQRHAKGTLGGARKPGRKVGQAVRRFTPEERRQAVEAFQGAGLTQADFCRTWGITPITLRSWLDRYASHGPKGLEDKQRGPAAGSRVPESVRAAIVTTKREHPEFGMRRVRDMLFRFLGIKISANTIGKTLKEEGFDPLPVKRRPKRKIQPPRRFERARPQLMWQSDITSLVLRRQGRRVYLVVFMDDHSRFIVGFGLHTHQRQDIVLEAFQQGLTRFSKPKEVLTDQGRQYYAWRGKAAFQKLLDREGIQHVVSRPHHPQTLGKCERFWQTVQREFWDRAKPEDLDDARSRLKHFIAHYNFFRPHQGIDGAVPADRFFGAGDALRATLLAQLTRNELRLSIDRPVRKPVYVFGQIGDQQVSVHGEDGHLIVQTPDGLRRSMKLFGSTDKQEPHHDPAGADAIPESSGNPEKTAQNGPQADPLPGAEALPHSGQGALGCGDSTGATDRSPDRGGHPGVVVGQVQQSGDLRAPGPASSADVAALAAGSCGYARRRSEAAADTREGRSAHDGSQRRSEDVEEGERGAEAQAGTDGEAQRDPSGVARKPAEGNSDAEEEDEGAEPTRVAEKTQAAADRNLTTRSKSRNRWWSFFAGKRTGEETER